MANKWTQPDAPPPPLFTGAKERDLVKQVNDENWPPELDQDFKNTVDKQAIKKLKKDQLKQVSDILDKIDY